MSPQWAIAADRDWFGQYFYNDVFRYSPEKVRFLLLAPATRQEILRMNKDEWRKFVSPTCPGPRSAHAVVATSAGGGKLFLFGKISQTSPRQSLEPTQLRRAAGGAVRRGVFVPISEQFPSLQRFLVFRRFNSVVGSY